MPTIPSDVLPRRSGTLRRVFSACFLAVRQLSYGIREEYDYPAWSDITPAVEALRSYCCLGFRPVFRSTHIFSLDVCLVPSPCPGSLAFLCWLFFQAGDNIEFRSRASVDGDLPLVCSSVFAAAAILLCLHSIACETYVCRAAVSSCCARSELAVPVSEWSGRTMVGHIPPPCIPAP